MQTTEVSPLVIRSENPWKGVSVVAACTLFAVGFVLLATVALTRGSVVEWQLIIFLAVFWAAVLCMLGWTVYLVLWAWRYGRSTLRLDDSPLRAGSWISGVIEAPERIDAPILQLSVVCIDAHYRLSNNSRLAWEEMKLIDGSRLTSRDGKLLIPFAIRLPADGLPSSFDRRKQQCLLACAASGRCTGREVRGGSRGESPRR